MNTPRRTPSGLLVTLLLLTALSPLATVQAQPDQASEYYYGVEYDWTSLDSDLQNVSGLDIQALFTEIMDDATDAGFNLDLGQLTTGATNVYVHQTEDITPQTIQNLDGDDFEVWSRTSDVTLRHGILSNFVLLTDWSEPASFGGDPTSFDIDVIAEAENVLTVDILYTEYLNDAYELVGADIGVDMTVGNDMNLGVDIALEGGGEEMTVDFDTGINFEYSISSDAVWRLGSASPIYIEAAENDYTSWDCVEDEMDIGVYEEDWGETYVYDDCGLVDGSYTGSADYEVYLTGLPTEEFGLDAGQFDLTISDAFQNSGDYEEAAEMGWVVFSMMEETLEVDLGDGAMVTAKGCDSCPPGNPVMFSLLGNVLAYSSSAFGEAVAEDFEAQLDESVGDLLEDWFGSAEGDDYDYDNSEYEWTCDNGEVINIWSVNDGWEDCADGSDEMDFYLQSYDASDDDGNPVYAFWGSVEPSAIGMDDETEEVWFMCADGQYDVPWEYVNDGGEDCADGSDEAQYEYGDETTMFECADGSDTIYLSWVNDGEEDCADGSDESQYDQSTGEETTMFTCADGSDTFELSWVNDDYADCFDGSDESQYDETETSTYLCEDGTETIPFSNVNNGWEDCADGSDEVASNEVADDWFYCSDWSTSVPFQWVNDGEADCADGSDEYDATNPTDFYCDADDATISFEAVNDGMDDCSDGADEGSAFYMMLDIWMDDGEGNMIMNANELLVCSDYSACDVYFSPGDSMYINTGVPVSASMGYGEIEQCIGAELYDSLGNFLVDMDMCETDWNGPQIYSMDLWFNNNEAEIYANAGDWDGDYYDITMDAVLHDADGVEVWSDSVAFDGYDVTLMESFDVADYGEYCLTVTLTEDGESEAFEEQTMCEEATEEPEPSDRLMAIAEAFAESGLEEVLTAFGENLEQTFTDVAENQETPEFPYVDGMWAPLWSTEHATIVGVGVYAWDEDDNGYVIAGPETTGYSTDLPMVFASINYITGVSAQEAQTAMADIDTLEDIVDVESHDLDSLAEALEEAGVDTSTLDITDSTDDNGDDGEGTPSAEDIAEDAGLLPFMSPFALVAMIGLAVAFAQSGREEDE
ncbi:MAG: hypothetical protein ACO20Y_04675 [Poseidonia sp.]